MNILNSLDVLIGLIVIYLVLGLACTVINEWIDATLHVRAAQLRKGIVKMLSTIDGKSLGDDFFNHSMVKSLERDTNYGLFTRQDKPTYISSRTFRETLLNILKNVVQSTPINVDGTFEEIEDGINKLPDSDIKEQLQTIISEVKRNTKEATDCMNAFQTALDKWFDESMERTSDWYKRRVQLWTFLSGIIFCTVLNIDTLKISQYLWQNPEARAAYVKAADAIVRQTSSNSLVLDSLKKQLSNGDSLQITEAKQQIDSLTNRLRTQLAQGTTIPMGWETEEIPTGDALLGYWLRKLAGLIISIGAVSAGAPFWFDMLKKVMNIRSALKMKTIGKE
ncbi:hypothetical protein [Runella salmonicolor]|uniref:Uncharacterized protein n=1 Tax=Runella salmonicolor TaxID=2950278 RepID=A0ABT1FIH4_9BACT|nr:hypothetical protein [Runella salmonicolor]MCP1381544.1 hypothetical protein [Runella salmonicolor]